MNAAESTPAPVPPAAFHGHAAAGAVFNAPPEIHSQSFAAGLAAYRTADPGRANANSSSLSSLSSSSSSSTAPNLNLLPRHNPTNMSLTDDIKSALRIGESDSAAAAAARRSAAMDAASAASVSSLLLRQMEQQQQQQQLHLPPAQQLAQPPLPMNVPAAATAPRGAVRLAATNLRAGGGTASSLVGQPLRPPMLLPEQSGHQGVRLPMTQNIPSDANPPQ